MADESPETDTASGDSHHARAGAQRRSRRLRVVLVSLAGAAVVVALGATGLVLFLGEDEDPPPPAKPLALTAPQSVDEVYSVAGDARLTPQEIAGVVDSVEDYLRAATITPIEHDPEAEDGDDRSDAEDGDASASAEPPELGRFFTDPAARRLDTDDRRALADDFLPFAKYGVSTERATVELAALVGDGGAAVVAATIDVQTVVRYEDDDVIVDRRGRLVLEPADGRWVIRGYDVRAERIFGSETTTTSEAAFG